MQFYYITAIFLFVAVVTAAPTEEAKDIIEKAHEECQADPKSKIDDATLEKIKNHEKVDESKLSKHALCLNVKLGIQQENGDVIADKIRAIAEKHNDDKDKVNKIVEDCGTRATGTAEEAAVALDKCLKDAGIRPRPHGPPGAGPHGPGPRGPGPHHGPPHGQPHGQHKN